jgi:hypothetical protein
MKLTKNFIFSFFLFASLQLLSGCMSSDGAVATTTDTGALPTFDFGDSSNTAPTTVTTTAASPTKLDIESAKTLAIQNAQYLQICLQIAFQFYDIMNSSTTDSNVDSLSQKADQALVNCYTNIAYKLAQRTNRIQAMQQWYTRVQVGMASIYQALGLPH